MSPKLINQILAIAIFNQLELPSSTLSSCMQKDWEEGAE